MDGDRALSASERAYVEGFKALLAQQKPTANPYDWHTERALRNAWIAGYARGRTELAMKMTRTKR